MITSKTNQKIKNLKKLLDSGKARKEQGLFVAEGDRIAAEIPSALLKEIYLSETRYKKMQGQKETGCLSGLLKEHPFEVVSDDVFRSISDTVNPQGVAAVVKQPAYRLNELLPAFEEGAVLVAILDNLRDPGNMGTVIRTCEAAGVSAVILSPDCVDIFNPKVVRSTMGSIFRVPFVTEDLPCAIETLKERGFSVYGSSLEESRSYRETEYGSKTAFITGNEANGIRKEILALTTANVIIPMQGKVESLNAAVSLAVLLFHWQSVRPV